jgi:hypothetical protein
VSLQRKGFVGSDDFDEERKITSQLLQWLTSGCILYERWSTSVCTKPQFGPWTSIGFCRKKFWNELLIAPVVVLDNASQ